MSVGAWIAIIVILFIVGSIMGLKPSGIDQRLDKLRMTARKLSLNPKLVACPEWLRGKDNEYGRGMMGQYGIVLDGYKMPHVRYHLVDGLWRPVSQPDNTEAELDFSLDKVAVDLPASIKKFCKGIEAKANSIVLYWDDTAYVRPATNPNYDVNNIEQELLQLKSKLTDWATIIVS